MPPELETESAGAILAGRFRTETLLGRGGMASVYLAHDEALERQVAVKLYRTDVSDPDEVERQTHEMRTLATLNHPSLVTLFDAGVDAASGTSFLVMEYVEGEDLRDQLKNGTLLPAEVAALGAQMAEALAYIHDNGVIHRDIKPGNIIMTSRPDDTGLRAKLADFGIARFVDGGGLTATGMVLGTASYVSPEQAMGGPISGASDLYSLGLVLLECLTGKRAFEGSAAEVMSARVNTDVPIPDSVPPAWAGLLRQMTARGPAERPSARDVARHIVAIAESGGAQHPLPTAHTEATTTLIQPAAESPHPSTPPRTSPPDRADASARTSSRAGAKVFAALLAVLVAAVIAVLAFPQLTTLSAEPPIPPDYPAVEGDLGLHLEQLQRSVTP